MAVYAKASGQISFCRQFVAMPKMASHNFCTQGLRD
jgi:hypothetical protein